MIPRRLPHPPRSTLAALALALLAHAGMAHAAPRVVYSGTLQGAGDVVMELDAKPADNGMLTGRYFYPKRGVDIPLKGTPQALVEPKTYQALVEAGKDPESDDPAAHAAATWQGTRGADSYQGHWTDARTGKQRAFTLRRVAEYDPDASAPGSVQAVTNAISGGVGSGIDVNVGINAQTAPYETLKLAGHAVPLGQDSGTGPVAYRMWRDQRTKFTYPRLIRHPDPQVLTRINGLLEQRHWQMNLAALACMASAYTDGNPAAGTLGSYDDEAVTVAWLSKALMTVTEAGSLYCGGAHPDNHFEPYTFDLLRGEYLDWNRVLDAYVPGEDGYRKESPALLALMEKARAPLAASNAKVGTDDDSLESCSDLWPSYLALGTESPGVLTLSISGIGHAMGVCLGTHATVPFKDLTPYLAPGGQAYLVTE
ncbi:hypothetical protein [Achromobacter sp. UMC46]|uniref:hypothetical protein n=1 Tax=Achromobacter sp. UMC46 TaxID=1862319 RepID=UPI00160056F3|nr:hypothetical protein [Achromobacter sp. UMC46]MBB1594238.1 hypothetical protein [Achromobacter sp. UMC46]